VIQFGPEVCSNVGVAVAGEWLETNGLGGFASSTIIGLNTRRYHGLLVAATRPPGGRLLLLSKLEEVLVVDGRRYELSANQYHGIIHPQGYQFLKGFRLDPFPVFTYVVGGFEIEKAVFMIYGENSTIVQYHIRSLDSGPQALSSQKKISLEVFPLIAFRDYHGITRQNNTINPYVETMDNLATVRPYPGLEELHFAHDAHRVEATGYWYRNFEYLLEFDRGLDYVEDLFNPLVLKFDLNKRTSASIVTSTQPHPVSHVIKYRQEEISRRQALVSMVPYKDEFIQTLITAADQFIVDRDGEKSILAGYPWFGDWGRDAMIALPGLTLVTGRIDAAKSILLNFSRHADQGLLPNHFSETEGPCDYHSVDATLWFFEALRSFVQYTGDYDFVKNNFYELLIEIIEGYTRGTRYGIHVDAEGLIVAGQEGVSLTWMDAKVGDMIVTPRHGKPVEVQALWYNALCVMEKLANTYGDNHHEKHYKDMAERTSHHFNKLFYNESAGCLFDTVDKDQRDGSIRPNQIFAVSLFYSMLSPEKSKNIVHVIGRDLLTPYGLRSLSPHDARYRGRYHGDQIHRDGAYHQGTVWPWLMGPFISAYLKVNDRSEKSREQSAQWLSTLFNHIDEAGLGQISEIFDGDNPHHPRGCIAQAWSVGELLRTAVEDIYNLRPSENKWLQMSRQHRLL